MKVTAIIVAGGVGSRMKAGINKVFLPLGGRTVIEHTVQTFLDAESVNEIVIVTRRDDISLCEKLFCRAEKNIKITEGGDTRQKSVYCGLKKAENEIAAIHDAVRALIDKRDIEKSICACEKYGAAALGISCVDSLKRADDDGFISETIDRTGVYRIQTPFSERYKICP